MQPSISKWDHAPLGFAGKKVSYCGISWKNCVLHAKSEVFSYFRVLNVGSSICLVWWNHAAWETTLSLRNNGNTTWSQSGKGPTFTLERTHLALESHDNDNAIHTYIYIFTFFHLDMNVHMYIYTINIHHIQTWHRRRISTNKTLNHFHAYLTIASPIEATKQVAYPCLGWAISTSPKPTSWCFTMPRHIHTWILRPCAVPWSPRFSRCSNVRRKRKHLKQP